MQIYAGWKIVQPVIPRAFDSSERRSQVQGTRLGFTNFDEAMTIGCYKLKHNQYPILHSHLNWQCHLIHSVSQIQGL
jgi:hypothetical protein